MKDAYSDTSSMNSMRKQDKEFAAQNNLILRESIIGNFLMEKANEKKRADSSFSDLFLSDT